MHSEERETKRAVPLESQRNHMSDFEDNFFGNADDDLVQIIRSGLETTEHVSIEEIEYAFRLLCERMVREDIGFRIERL